MVSNVSVGILQGVGQRLWPIAMQMTCLGYGFFDWLLFGDLSVIFFFDTILLAKFIVQITSV